MKKIEVLDTVMGAVKHKEEVDMEDSKDFTQHRNAISGHKEIMRRWTRMLSDSHNHYVLYNKDKPKTINLPTLRYDYICLF